MSLRASTAIGQLTSGQGGGNILQIPKSVEIYRPKAAGTVTLSIVPYKTTKCPIKGVKPGDLFWCRDYTMWRGVGMNGKKCILDNMRTFGDDRCAVVDALESYDGPASRKPRRQRMFLFNVYFPNEKKSAILDFSYSLFAEPLITAVKAKSSRPNKQYIDLFADPVEGCDITFTWEEDSFEGHKFFRAVEFDFDQHGGLPKEVLESAVDLDACLVHKSYEQVAAFIQGIEEEAAEPAPEPTSPPPPAAKVTTTKEKETVPPAAADDSPFDADWDD